MQRFQRLKFFKKYSNINEFYEKSILPYKNRRSFSQIEKRNQPIIQLLDAPSKIEELNEVEEKIINNLDKKQMKEIEKLIDLITLNKTKIDKKMLYLILNNSYQSNLNIAKQIHKYLSIFDDLMDSVLYSFIILSHCENNDFQESFILLTKCCSEGFQPLANVLIAMYYRLIQDKNLDISQKLEYKNFIDVQVKLFYNFEQYNSLFKKLSDEFNSNENVKFIDQKQKMKRKKSLNELLMKIGIDKKQSLDQIEALHQSKKELYNAILQEIKGKDEKEPKK